MAFDFQKNWTQDSSSAKGFWSEQQLCLVRLSLTYSSFFTPCRAHSFGPTGSWVGENLGSPRLMGDSVLLPNGKVVLLNGAQVRRGRVSCFSGGVGVGEWEWWESEWGEGV